MAYGDGYQGGYLEDGTPVVQPPAPQPALPAGYSVGYSEGYPGAGTSAGGGGTGDDPGSGTGGGIPVVLPPTPTRKPAPLLDTWTFATGPWFGMPVAELAGASARSCTWRLTGNHEASVTLTDSDAYAAYGANLGPASLTPAAAQTTTKVAVRIGYGNMQGPYATSDTSRVAQFPAQVSLITSMGIDLFAGVEFHADNDMDQALLTKLKAKDGDWDLAEGANGGQGNQLLFRPSLYSVVGKPISVSMGGGRSMSDFTVKHVTGLEVRIFVPHTRSDDDDGTDRDSERLTEIKFIAKRALKLDNVIVCGDFNFKHDTYKKLRGILATSGLIGLQTRQPGLPHGDDDSGKGNGGGDGIWIDDIFTKSSQTVSNAAGVKAGNASDHYLWMRADVGFTTSNIRVASSSLGPETNDGGIRELIWDLWVIRNGKALFRGRFGPSSDTIDEGGSISTQLGAADYRELLQRRFLYEGDKVDFTKVEQSDIAWSLLSSTQAKAGGNLGIVRGQGVKTGVVRDRSTYEAGASVGATIDLLAQVINGFDWDIQPNANDTSMTFDVFYPSRGKDRDVVLDYGGRVKSAVRQVDPAAFGNAVRGTGADTLTPVRQEAAGLAADPAGRWDLQYADDSVSVAQTLQDKVAAALADGQYLTPSWSVVLTPGTWNGPDDFWVGDTVTLVVKKGRLDVVESLRVLEFSVSLDENDVATITVTLGAPDPKLKRTVRSINRRLSALERR